MINFDGIIQHNANLRPYQVDMKKRIFETWQKGMKSIMMQMPTGTGKTILFCSIIKDIWDYHFDDRKPLCKFLILVHRKELIEQVQKTLYTKIGLAHGVIAGGRSEDEFYHIQVAMVHSLARDRRLQRWKDNEFDFIICDEAHHFLANDYTKIRATFPDAYLLGVTATPYRLNHQPFTDSFNILLRTKSVNKFIKEGWLSEYEYYSIEPTSKLQLEIDNLRILNTGDYSENAMSKALDNRQIRAGVVKTWLKYAKGKKTIVYTINQKHNEHLCNEFNDTGFVCIAIDSNTPKEEREEYVEQFRKREITIICNVNIFSEGFDCPDVECIQLARPTTSLSMYLQQVGRGLRIAENKDKTIFLDNVGLYNRFGLPSVNRQWQRHFEGKDDWDDKRDYNLEAEDIHRPRIIETEEEADDEFDMRYSNVEEKEDRAICNVSEFLGISNESIISMFRYEIEDIGPNTVLTEEQYDKLIKHLMEQTRQTKEGFISIFDVPNKDSEMKKNFCCKVKNYKTNEWETVFYKKFIDCYIDVINRVYCDYLLKTTDIKHKDKDMLESIKQNLKIERDITYIRSKTLNNGENVESNISNTDKISKLKYLLSAAGENMYFNFDKKISFKQILMTENSNKNNAVADAEVVVETEKENLDKHYMETDSCQNIVVKMGDKQYNIDQMNEKEIIELMLILHDKIDLDFLDEAKAEKRLKKIEEEVRLQELDKQIENSEYEEEEILRMAERIKQRKKEKEYSAM
ncbi:MAG: DEAD/DEAH box helicase [Bacteroidales bacterium]|nr:DEAD/DEAH box helicase [Bacteroidales bacterium]